MPSVRWPSDTAVGAVLQQRIDDDWSPNAFFSKGYNPVRHATVPLTASCLLFTLQSSTSGILLRDAASTSSLTTSPSPMLCRRIQTASPPGRSDTWTTSPSSRLTSTTFRDLAMLQQMPLSCIYLETNALLNSFHAIDFSVIAAAQHNPELRNWKSLSCASTRYNNHTHL